MNVSPLFSADIATIDAGNRLRPTDPDRVEALAASIAEIGLQQPIIVRPHPEGGNSLQLVAGAHRLEAAQRLCWTEIAAIWLDLDEAQARLVEIDENLIRNDLSPLDFALSVAERKRIYEALHPGSKWGGDRSKNQTADQGLNLSSWSGFAKDAAKRTGLSIATFKNASALAKNLAPEVVRLLRATPLANNGAALKKFSRQPHNEQLATARKLAAGEAKTIDDARAAAGLAPPPEKVDLEHQLMNRWTETLSRTSATQRRALLMELLRHVRSGELPALANEIVRKLPVQRQMHLAKALEEALAPYGETA